MEDLGFPGLVIVSLVAMFRDEKFLTFVSDFRHGRRVKELEAENRELIKQRDIAAALEAMLGEVGDDVSKKRVDAMKRVLSKGSNRH